MAAGGCAGGGESSHSPAALRGEKGEITREPRGRRGPSRLLRDHPLHRETRGAPARHPSAPLARGSVCTRPHGSECDDDTHCGRALSPRAEGDGFCTLPQVPGRLETLKSPDTFEGGADGAGESGEARRRGLALPGMTAGDGGRERRPVRSGETQGWARDQQAETSYPCTEVPSRRQTDACTQPSLWREKHRGHVQGHPRTTLR